MPVEIVFLAGFVSSVISILGNKVANSSLREIKTYLDVERNLLKLTSGIDCVQSALEKVDDKDSAHSSFKSWVEDLATLCYDVYDIIDDINLEITRLDREQITSSAVIANQRGDDIGCEVLCETSMSRLTPFLATLPTWLNYMGSRFQSSDRKTRIKKIISSLLTKWDLSNRIDDLVRRLSDIRTQVNDALEQSSEANITRQPRLFRGDHDPTLPSTMSHEKESIIKKLLNMEDGGITIVGMAGLGKSVLAHSILNDVMIRQSFNVINRASASKWNSVDHDITIDPIPSSSMSSAAQAKKSLLLLDDLRITGLTLFIITCRDPAVAKYTEAIPHPLKSLSVEDCEEIINTSVLSNRSKKHKRVFMENYYRLVLDSKVNCIAGKCGGLSLVADAIGSYLRSEYISSPRSFMKAISHVEQDDLWKQHVFLHEILPELGFDAKSLPKKLYRFLAYFALFPSDYKFRKNDVSLLWMAEGFAAAATEWTLTPAIDHFETLVSTSMLQPLYPSSPQVYQMHAFAHRYAQCIARCSYFWLNEGRLSSMETGDIPSNYTSPYIRHFSVCCQKLEESILHDIEKYHDRLRTLLLVKIKYRETKIGGVPKSLFKKLEYLRVLSLSGSDITELPTTVSNMRHLRYLDVSYTRIKKLPIEICNLLGLQVLKLKGCRKLVSLPKNFETLINLTYIELDMRGLSRLPTHLGKLTKLQTLPLFIVRSSEGQGVSELKNMKSLGGSLNITELENITNTGEAKDAMLHQKPKIKTLSLEWTKEQDPSKAEHILNGLRPSDKLKRLTVSNYSGNAFPNWVNTLKDVGDIHLYNCPNCNVLPHFGLLPLLKTLKLEKMRNIQTVARSSCDREAQTSDSSEYPALEYLKIRKMKKLYTWHMKPEDMPHLRHLLVSECPRLISCPLTSRMHLLQSPEITD